MRRVLTLLVVLAFWGLPMANARPHVFQPPSTKKMVKAPLLKGHSQPGESYTGKTKSGLLGRRR